MQQCKQDQRRQGITARQALSPVQRAAADAAICARITATGTYRRAACILLYAAANGEVNLSVLAAQARREGKHVSWPVCLPGHSMAAAEPLDDSAWETGRYGIRAPILTRAVQWPPERLSLVLVPCTAFDAQGRRVGMGGGYYDRFLPRCTGAACWAVAYACQQVPRAAVEPHDRAMDAVITEERAYGSIDAIQL